MREVDIDGPETAAIILPSDFDAGQRATLGLTALASLEFECRKNQALEALRQLRQEIRMYNWTVSEKKAQLHGVGATTRAQAYLKSLLDHIQLAGDTYRCARAALLSLGLPKDDKTFQPLTKLDQRGKGGLKVRPGMARVADPWYWHVARPAGQNEDQRLAWESEMDRVQWFRARASRDRMDEELEILEAEFSRSIRSFSKMRDVWTAMAEQKNLVPDNPDELGWRAYAFRQAAMYERLRAECVEAQTEAPILAAKDLEAEDRKGVLEARAKELEEELTDVYFEQQN
uniref:Uncharacterized protein n=1 Tax=Mycena chlorophos TaxID=658473 RepID=A0ABQ0L3J1_MYCCL|nr:predicted protein [Mycena chlorophos]